MAALSVFLPAVMIECDQVPLPVAEAMIVRAAGEFCEQSLVWYALSDPVSFEDGVSDYSIDLPTGARLVTIKEIVSDNGKIKGIPFEDLSREVSDWQGASGYPTHFVMSDLSPPTVRFYPTPNAAMVGRTFTARLVYAPSNSSTSLPDMLDSKYRYEIADGVKSILMGIANKPWSNPQRAAELGALFRMHIAKARISSEHGHVHNQSVVRSREFGL